MDSLRRPFAIRPSSLAVKSIISEAIPPIGFKVYAWVTSHYIQMIFEFWRKKETICNLLRNFLIFINIRAWNENFKNQLLLQL